VNKSDSVSHAARAHVRAIIDDALRAVDPREAVRRYVTVQGDRIVVAGVPHGLQPDARIFVLGAGKGSAAMAEGLEDALGGRIAGGHVTVKDGHGRPLHRISIGEASHPVPDARGVEEAEKALLAADVLREGDLAFCLISGGGSALWPAPVAGVSLADKQAVTQTLLSCGASIDEINAVRKHLSRIKGGHLARVAHPATLIGLLISDVPGDRPDVIASGPTCPDQSTYSEALGVLGKYQLAGRVPEAVLRHLRDGQAGVHPETPKPGDEAFQAAQNVVVANNRMALGAAADSARRLGYRVRIVNGAQAGDSVALADGIAAEIESWHKASDPSATCLIWGGETTMVLPANPGEGGRNQHLALCVASRVAGDPSVVFASVGTDGTDGPTDAAGGIIDGGTAGRVRMAGLEVSQELRACNSYRALLAAGDLLITGPTMTNVMDLQILLLGAPPG